MFQLDQHLAFPTSGCFVAIRARRILPYYYASAKHIVIQMQLCTGERLSVAVETCICPDIAKLTNFKRKEFLFTLLDLMHNSMQIAKKCDNDPTNGKDNYNDKFNKLTALLCKKESGNSQMAKAVLVGSTNYCNIDMVNKLLKKMRQTPKWSHIVATTRIRCPLGEMLRLISHFKTYNGPECELMCQTVKQVEFSKRKCEIFRRDASRTLDEHITMLDFDINPLTDTNGSDDHNYNINHETITHTWRFNDNAKRMLQRKLINVKDTMKMEVENRQKLGIYDGTYFHCFHDGFECYHCVADCVLLSAASLEKEYNKDSKLYYNNLKCEFMYSDDIYYFIPGCDDMLCLGDDETTKISDLIYLNKFDPCLGIRSVCDTNN